MKSVVVLIIAIICAVSASNIILDSLKHLSKEGKEQLCNQINHKSHQMFSPFRCMKEGEDLGAAGKKFKAAHPNLDATTLNPVVLLPGLGGSSLDAEVHKQDAPSWYCFKNLDWFRIWFAVEEILVQPCWMDNLQISYNTSTGNYTNREGVNIRPTDFGGVKGVAYLDYKFGIPISLTSYYSSIIKSLEEIGYVAGQNLHGAPYDWRLPATFLEKNGWNAQLQNLIETTYANNGNLPVHIVTHSMGGPTGLYFLNSMPQAWLDQYVASFVPIAGPWTGAPNALRAVVSGDNFGLTFAGIDILSKKRLRDVARGAGGVIELIPNTDLNTANKPFVSDGVKNYTIADFPQLFLDLNLTGTNEIYSQVGTIVESLHAPQVPVHCAYGYGVPTESFYTYSNGFSEDPIIDESQDGDGTVPLYSLQECQRWVKEQPQPVDNKEFNLVGHSDILHDEEFIQYLLGIVTSKM